MCFPRGFTGLEFGEKEGDLIRSFIRQILSIYFVSGTLKGFHRAFGGGGERLCLQMSSTF